VHCRVNAGEVPQASWVNDPRSGGDRIRGEVCHFIDLVQFLAGARCISVDALALTPRRPGEPPEDCAVLLRLADGSIANVVYTARGPRRLGRERIEAFRGGRAVVIDDFRTTRLTGAGRSAVHRTWSVDRGHRAEVEALARALRGTDQRPVDVSEYVATTAATLAVLEALEKGGPCAVAP
jgi:predicted dehydrogenase